MLLEFAQWLARDVRVFNVFNYITLRAVLACLTALAISLVLGPLDPETCRRMVAAGNVVGNHSYHHLKSLCLRRGRTVAHDIELAQQAIYECTGLEPKLFRPPHGFRTPWLMRAVRNLGYKVVT